MKKKKNRARYELFRPKPLTLTLFNWMYATSCGAERVNFHQLLSFSLTFRVHLIENEEERKKEGVLGWTPTGDISSRVADCCQILPEK